MIKKWFVKRLFYLLLVFFIIFAISLSFYFYLSAKTNYNTLQTTLNLVRGDLSISHFMLLNQRSLELFNIVFFQIISFIVATVSLVFVIGFLFRLYNVQKRGALIDPLTELYNRRAVIFGLTREISRAKRYAHDLSVAMIDIDYFKNYNDTNGHIAGDNVLKKVAQIIKTNIRESDIVGRFGGEEFLIVFPETGLKEAVNVCEDLRQKIESTKFSGESKLANKQISVSIGVACAKKGKIRSKWVIIDKADKKLYDAKKEGRNIVKF